VDSLTGKTPADLRRDVRSVLYSGAMPVERRWEDFVALLNVRLGHIYFKYRRSIGDSIRWNCPTIGMFGPYIVTVIPLVLSVALFFSLVVLLRSCVLAIWCFNYFAFKTQQKHGSFRIVHDDADC